MQLFEELVDSLDPQLTELPFDWDDVFVAEMEASARRTEAPRLAERPELRTVAPAAAAPLDVTPEMPMATRRMAATYNRLGGLLDAVAAAVDLAPPLVLALYFVESGGRASEPGRTPLYFDNRRFYDLWGARNRARYARHFAHGARGDDDRFRARADGPLRPLHGDGYAERDALATATRLAGEDTALRALRVGVARLPLAEHRRLGYATPAAMRQALDDERYQVLGLFDLLRGRRAPDGGDLLGLLRDRRCDAFAEAWHPGPDARAYAARLGDAVDAAERLLERAPAEAPAAEPPPEPRTRWVETGWWLPHRHRRPPWHGLRPHGGERHPLPGHRPPGHRPPGHRPPGPRPPGPRPPGPRPTGHRPPPPRHPPPHPFGAPRPLRRREA